VNNRFFFSLQVFLLLVFGLAIGEEPLPIDALGIDLSMETGFHGFAWGTYSTQIIEAFGEPSDIAEQNGVVEFRYLTDNALSAFGLRSFIFWDGKLIAGEYGTLEVPAQRAEPLIESIIGGISHYFQQAPDEPTKGTARWIRANQDTLIMFILREGEGEDVFALTLAQLTMAHRFLRLTRYGPSLEEVEKMDPITLEDLKD